jgi:hypothetical protein
MTYRSEGRLLAKALCMKATVFLPRQPNSLKQDGLPLIFGFGVLLRHRYLWA